MNTNPLPDLSGWHPLPDDATVPDDSPVAEVGKITRIIYVYPPPYRSQAPAERLGTPYDYFTPEPVASPPPLPTEPGTWIVADVRGGQEDLVLRLNENGDWIGVTDNRSMVSVPASYIEDWREVRWVPANEPLDYPEELEKLRAQVRAASKATPEDLDEPKPVQRVELKIDDAGSSDPCGEESPDNIGYKCTRTSGHDFLSLHSPNLHVASDYDGIITIWGEVS